MVQIAAIKEGLKVKMVELEQLAVEDKTTPDKSRKVRGAVVVC